MYERTHRHVVTSIVIGGHLALFLYGLIVLAIMGGRITADFFQLILMASPVLASTSLLAFTKLLDDQGRGPRGPRLPRFYVALTLLLPIALIALIGVVFTLFATQSSLANPDQLKVSLGVIETFFGGYIGALAKKLFS